MLQWTKSKQDMDLQAQIMRRARDMVSKWNSEKGNGYFHYPNLDIIMDVDACHSNGCPLDLQALLAADDQDFAHDVFGIRRHINRKTGQLMDCFLPRYAA